MNFKYVSYRHVYLSYNINQYNLPSWRPEGDDRSNIFGRKVVQRQGKRKNKKDNSQLSSINRLLVATTALVFIFTACYPGNLDEKKINVKFAHTAKTV